MNIQIPSARVPLIDSKTGLISREWFQFLFQLSVTNPKIKTTDVGGIAVLLTNKSGATSIKGYLVDASPTVNNAVRLVPVNSPDCIGAFLDSGVPDGAEAWIVVSGIADVYFFSSTTRGHYARVGVTADTGEAAGQALSEAIPTSPFATDKHFMEIGHVLESRTGAGLAKCCLHFN
jgi:hypothetical protein